VSTTKSRLNEVSLVAVPVADQDRSIEFYVETLGFEKRTDIPFGDKYRWVEVYPPNGTTGLAIAPPPDPSTIGTNTGIILTTDDIDSTHAELSSRGVDVDENVSHMGDPVPPMFWFRDPDGNMLLVIQPAS
jgi:predicted enzyme related to lactoylglutathione lyase